MGSKMFEDYKREREERDARDRAYLETMGIAYPKCGFWVDAGWRPLVEETLKKLIAAGWDKQLSQVKQKFCELRIYLEPSPIPREPALRAIIDAATKRSHDICEGCGLERELKGMRAGRAYCNACNKAESDKYAKYHEEEEE